MGSYILSSRASESATSQDCIAALLLSPKHRKSTHPQGILSSLPVGDRHLEKVPYFVLSRTKGHIRQPFETFYEIEVTQALK